jgi:long-chain fatty acid transport protein
MRKRALLAFAALFVLSPESARASGFSTARFGSEHGNPTESNPTALYYNPAGIAFSEGTHVFAEGQLAIRHVTWEHQQSKTDVPEPAGAAGANFGKANLTNVFGAPALGVTSRFGDLAVGAGVFVPFGGRAAWDPNEAFRNHPSYPLAVDGIQRWHGIDGAITFLYLTAGAAYKFGRFSVGASGNFILSSIKFTLAKALVNGDNDMDAEGRSQIDVKRNIGSFALGAMFEAIEQKLWIGASYQAAPGLGDITMKGTLTITQGDAQLVRDVDFHQKMPDVFRAGARYRPVPEWEIRAFGDFTRWSRLESQCISLADQHCAVTRNGASAPGAQTVNSLYRGWSDTIGVRLGVSHWFTSSIEAFVGAGFESSAVPDATLEPTLFDSNTISGAIGGRFELMEHLWLGVSWTHIQYLARDNTGKSILADPSVDPITRRVDGGGKYTSFVGVGALSLEKQF